MIFKAKPLARILFGVPDLDARVMPARKPAKLDYLSSNPRLQLSCLQTTRAHYERIKQAEQDAKKLNNTTVEEL